MPAKRRPVNKAFTGCARCKASKVKCDERKPSCSRCNSRKLPCPGYPGVVIRWSTKHEVFRAPDLTDTLDPSPGPTIDVPPFSEPNFPSISLTSDDEVNVPKTSLSPRRCSNPISKCPTANFIVLPEDQNTVILANAHNYHGSLNGSSLGSYLSSEYISISTDISSVAQTWPVTIQSQEDHEWPTTNLAIPRKTFIPPTISHLPATLVSYYFKDVCSIFSSFDSELNPFRTYVSQTFSYSGPVFNAMLSSSAARLADEVPQLKITGLQYQGQALRCIAESLKQGSVIPEDTLFAIFLIGLSTAWHDGRDIGLAHFHAAQRAISSNLISFRDNDRSMANFFKSALIYWEMALSLVSDDVEFSSDIGVAVGDKPDIEIVEAGEPSGLRIVPHPWTGISSSVQSIFSRVTKVIRSLRFVESLSDADLLRYQKLIQDAEKLEGALWSLALPSIAEIDDSGDPNTPASHHILLAEAYIFGALYQIYCKFPDLLERRRGYASAMESPQSSPENNPLGEWYRSLSDEACEKTLLRSLGFNILDRLQQIPITSGTRSVQAILIFVAAGSLEMPSLLTLEPSLLKNQTAPVDIILQLDIKRVMDMREFTIARLSSLRKLVHSRPVDLMLQVIKEMFRRLDMGADIFWIDIIHEMECETMLG